MKQWIAFVLFTGAIGYILGQAGALECDTITIKQYIIRTGIGIAVLGFDALLINRLTKKDLPGRQP